MRGERRGEARGSRRGDWARPDRFLTIPCVAAERHLQSRRCSPSTQACRRELGLRHVQLRLAARGGSRRVDQRRFLARCVAAESQSAHPRTDLALALCLSIGLEAFTRFFQSVGRLFAQCCPLPGRSHLLSSTLPLLQRSPAQSLLSLSDPPDCAQTYSAFYSSTARPATRPDQDDPPRLTCGFLARQLLVYRPRTLAWWTLTRPLARRALARRRWAFALGPRVRRP